jgi:transposase
VFALEAQYEGRLAMEHVGMDIGLRESQLAILTEAGELLDKRIRTERDRLVQFFGSRAKAKILIEASTESEWIARCLEELGHDVVVADPNYAPMYCHRTRRIKTDRRDAHALAEACRLGGYRPAHRASDQQQQLKGILAIRDNLVRTRARWMVLIRSLLRREGIRVPKAVGQVFARRVQELELPGHLGAEVAPLLSLLPPLNEQIQLLDQQLAQIACTNETAQRLTTVPGVGAVTAVSFLATLDQASRFQGAHQVESYLGLVPMEWSSSETQRRGHITKAGNGRMRWLLVEAAWRVLAGRRSPAAAPLRAWAERLAQRRGRSVAAVALARRLAGILYAVWRDRCNYDPLRLEARSRSSKSVPVA